MSHAPPLTPLVLTLKSLTGEGTLVGSTNGTCIAHFDVLWTSMVPVVSQGSNSVTGIARDVVIPLTVLGATYHYMYHMKFDNKFLLQVSNESKVLICLSRVS